MNRVVRPMKMIARLRAIMEHPEGEAALCGVFALMHPRACSVVKTWINRTDQVLRAIDNPEVKEPLHIAPAVFMEE